MGYFSNGTSGDMFEAEWCNRCAHENDEMCCPVMLAHILYAYELCNEDAAKNPGKHVLDMLIARAEPAVEQSGKQKCAMFLSADRLVRNRGEGP
jgi:hypothetical protein